MLLSTFAGLVLAGAVHLLLTPEHLGMSVPLGLGFLVAGVAQVAVAYRLVLMTGPRRRLLDTAIVLSAALLVVYGVEAMIGLPLLGHEAAHTTHADRTLGAPALEAVLAKGGETVTLVAAVVLRRRLT